MTHINKAGIILIALLLLQQKSLWSQTPSTVYTENNGRDSVTYYKPHFFSFFTHLPQDGAGIVTNSFKRENIKPLFAIGGATVLLLFADGTVSHGVQTFSKQIHFQAAESYRDIYSLKMGKTNVSILKAPQNINTALYQMGQGFPTMLISAGLFTYGKIQHDYRALSTASQLTETFILMGVGTQLLKRITGRQSPSNATDEGGNWHFFPSFKNFENNTPNFDAFPSGHLATIMSTVTILAENYPDNKLIKPVGYSLMGLVGAAMINNNVHWISDYPLAIALGYMCAKQVAKRNRGIIKHGHLKTKEKISYTLNYSNKRPLAGLSINF